MLTTEIKINGITIGIIHAQNKGKYESDNNYTVYKFQYWRPGDTNVSAGTILHVREEGAEVLIQKILHLVRPVEKGASDGKI